MLMNECQDMLPYSKNYVRYSEMFENMCYLISGNFE